MRTHTCLALTWPRATRSRRKRSGQDPTTFNKSKRVTFEGKLRWPSNESVAKVLAITGATLNEYVSYMGDSGGAGVYRHIPLIGFPEQASKVFSTMGDTPQVAAGRSFPLPDSQTHKLAPQKLVVILWYRSLGTAMRLLYRQPPAFTAAIVLWLKRHMVK